MGTGMDKDIKNENVSEYIENQDYVANKYTMKCFMVTMLVFTAIFILNQLGIFIIRKKIMWEAFFPSLLIYLLAYIVAKIVPLSNKKMKYFLMFCITLVFTIIGVFLTYHVVLVSLFPFLYATLYSSKPMMRFVCFLTVISTIIIVYGGYYFGLCDANMILLTTDVAKEYIADGHFILNEVNNNPYLSLMLFFVIPRCLIYIAFMAVCSSLFNIVSGSLEKARLAGELEKAKTEAENANRAKSRFLAKMSHEIRTPINAVLGMNEMIIRESNEEAIREYAYDVKNSSELLLNIVNEILDSSKIESGMMEIVPVNYKMGSLLNDLYNMINIKIQDKKLKLVFNIDPSIPSEYYGDDSRIRQVLLNLLTNAVKYTDEGTVTMEVRCSTDNENAVLHYSVKDTGIGISEENIGKIYDEFQRFDLSRNRSVEGTGLGMNIVQQLLKLMGSELHIKSEYGKGSEFYFDIEQKIVNAEPLGDFRKKFIQSAQKDNIRTEYFAPKAKVLVVDDNKINLKVFTRLIKKTQIQVYEAESGKECLELLRSQPVDMIFLDHMMPEMDGIETLHAIRDNKLCEGTPVIMLTANAIVGDREKYINEGFDDFLSKPIIPDELDKMILKHLPEELVITEGNNKK
ncbi:MAG: response regulator [Bacteroides sp.]